MTFFDPDADHKLGKAFRIAVFALLPPWAPENAPKPSQMGTIPENCEAAKVDKRLAPIRHGDGLAYTLEP